MSSDKRLDPVVGGNGSDEPVDTPRLPEPPRVPEAPAEREDHPVVAWAKAIFGGIGDTAKEMLDEGRRGAQEAYDDGWRRFDDKTRYRRTPRR